MGTFYFRYNYFFWLIFWLKLLALEVTSAEDNFDRLSKYLKQIHDKVT